MVRIPSGLDHLVGPDETEVRFRILTAEPTYSYCSVIPKHIYTYLPIPILSVRYNYFLFYILRV